MPLVAKQSSTKSTQTTNNDVHFLKSLKLSYREYLSRGEQWKARLLKVLTLTATASAIAACGGSGGNSDSSIPTAPPSTAAQVSLSYEGVKGFKFDWSDVTDSTYYQILENADGNSGFTPVGGRVNSGVETNTITVPLYKRINARYILQSCNDVGCADSPEVSVSGDLVGSIGYFKASNTDTDDLFGTGISLSSNGDTLAIGAPGESSSARGINGNQSDNSAFRSGAVYIFVRSGSGWSQQAYLKASNSQTGDSFGESISLSHDGNTLAVAARFEDSGAVGVNGDQNSDSASSAGAAYIFKRSNSIWSQEAYIKASNTDPSDRFGTDLSLSGDGNTLAVGATYEDGGATGINGNESSNTRGTSGAVYVYTRNSSTWSQQAYVKASNANSGDQFGSAISLSQDGNRMAVSALGEGSDASGINGSQTSNDASFSGAVYVFERVGTSWSQQAYVKASNTDEDDSFGRTVTLSNDGNTLAVSSVAEQSNSMGINGDQSNNSAQFAGAVYVFRYNNTAWAQEAYIKAGNAETRDQFGAFTSLSGDGNLLLVGADQEKSNSVGLNGDQSNNAQSLGAGAAYLFEKSGGAWSQISYMKNAVNDTGDNFANGGTISNDGQTIAITASFEKSNASGIGSDIANNSLTSAGAVYLY